MDYNKFDRKYQVDRTSILTYRVQNGLACFPYGRIGIMGRNKLYYWGPNLAIQAIFTRFMFLSEYNMIFDILITY